MDVIVGDGDMWCFYRRFYVENHIMDSGVRACG